MAPRPTLREIYQAELPYVWNTLRRLGVPARHVQDVAQEVFLVVHRILDRYDPNRPLKPWLFAITFRTASDFCRRAHVHREVFDPTLELADDGPDPEARLESARRRKQVHLGLAALDDDLRAVLILVDLDGCTAPEAAEALSIPLNTVYSRLRRGRQSFLAIMQAAAGIGGEP